MENRNYFFSSLAVMILWVFFVINAPLAFKCCALDDNENPYQAEVEITQELIDNTKVRAPEVKFTPKIEKEISIMEKRHFKNPPTNETDGYRIARLEDTLMGKVWEYTPLETRMRRLKLASQRVTLAGTSLPNNLSRIYTQKRIRNDSIELREIEQVGIIDGLLRVYAPDLYEKVRFRNNRHFEYFGME